MLSEDWHAHPHVSLLRTVASAVVQLADVTGLSAFSLPYPPDAQRALDRMIVTCLVAGVEEIPRSVPDLVTWCRTRPLEDWPLDLPADAFGPDDYLVDPDSCVPTQLCHEWWVQGRDSTATQFDRDVIRAAMRLCQQVSAPDSYMRLRQLMVTQPVLTAADEFDIATEHLLEPVRELIGRCYAPAPLSYRSEGMFRTCGRCLTLLTPVAAGGWWCERDACRRRGPATIGRTIIEADAGGVSQLVRPLRQFVTGPGRAEVDLQRRLGELRHGEHKPFIEMWPGFDAYDLRVSFPDGHVWAIDVKDWRHPGLLGRAAKVVRPEPPYDEACWVVPREQVNSRPGYLDIFHRNRPRHAAELTLLVDDELVRRAQDRLRGRDVSLRNTLTTNGAAGA
jgi:restriction endonuclease in pPIWI_RE module